MKRSSILLLVAGLSFATACGSDDDAESPPAGTSTLADGCISAEQGEPADGYVGLDETGAQELAASEGLTVRVVGVDGECLPMTMDLRDDRVNLDIVDGVVVTASMF
jgi:hypothetical protein